jgi:3',5'-cyclic AMP phosphodiesterase CpdA
MDLRIAVVSDLHCHNKNKNRNTKESYLLTDEAIPDNENPLLSFRQFIKDKKDDGDELTADILIIPGDITNKCDADGLVTGWKITKEIASLLKVKIIVSTLGNHDVYCKKSVGLDPYELTKSLLADFPFPDANLNKEFWEDGFTFLEESNCRILVINSTFNHSSEKDAVQGTIPQVKINLIEKKLQRLESDKKKYNIAICHHHPIPHERHYLGTHDLIENGTELVELLGKYDYQIIIHGHKHDPLIRYGPGGTNSPVVFSAGSFSAFKTLLLSGAYNTFHLVTIEHTVKRDCANHGKIDTWFFTPSKGWATHVINEYIESKVGFGCRTPLKQLANDIHQWFLNGTIDNYEWKEFIKNFEMVEYLLPNDKIKLNRFLKDLKISVENDFEFHTPSVISFKRK